METDASSSIVNKVSNDAGSNTSTQLSYETKEEMSQADGKTASYLRGAAEEKSQLTDVDKKTTIDTIAGQTNTNITDGTNTSNDLQKADQIASSVTDGTNTTVVNQDAKSLASSITDGTKANNTNNTVDKSEQLIKANDTQYSATTKTATKMEDALVSGSNIIDVIKGLDAAGNPLISSAVTDGTTITGISQNAKDINLSAAGGTITNDAQNITNKAAETLSNSAKNIANTTTDTLHVTSTSTFDGTATFKDIVTMEKDLSVAGSMTASSYKVGDKTYIDSNGINANDQKVVNVAPGRIAADSKDAINGSQLYQTNERVTSVENRVGTVENRVDKLDSRVDKVGANAAALANLHPLEFDADSKWNIAAAVGGYKGETATAIGAFYRPNENVMVNVSSSFGTGENMYGSGISLRIGQGGNKARRNATNGLTEREKAMQKQIDSLTSRLDALLSVINPNMSKDFPDVPENHWAYEAVSRLAGNGVIQGYEDGKYHGDRTMTRYEMAEIIYNALSKGAKAEKKLVEEFKPELQAMAAQKKA